LFDGNGKKQSLDPKENIYFYQEDSRGLIEKADPDLREYGCSPVPWRRVYGFAQNSQILDRGFLYGSIVIIFIWHFAPGNNLHLLSWSNIPAKYYLIISVAYASVMVLFFAGESSKKLKRFNFIKYLIFPFGLILFSIWIILFRDEIITNLRNIFSNPVAFSIEAIVVPLVIILMIIQKTKGKPPAVV
jgi:hypothetical protein